MIKTTVATSIKYGNYKHMQRNVKRWQKVIEKNWALICKAVGISDKEVVKIHWRPIKGTVKGNYASHIKTINMDSRKYVNTQDMIETLGHELTHFKQYSDGRLKVKYDQKISKWTSIWGGKTFRPATTWNAYYNLPWEEDARDGGHKVRVAYIQNIEKVWKEAKNNKLSPKT